MYRSMTGGSTSSSSVASSKEMVESSSVTSIVTEIWEEENDAESESIVVLESESAASSKGEYEFENSTIKNFVMNDTYILEGTISGSLTQGYDIDFADCGYSEHFDIGIIGLDGTLYDSNGFDWEYKRAGDIEAEEALEAVKN